MPSSPPSLFDTDITVTWKRFLETTFFWRTSLAKSLKEEAVADNYEYYYFYHHSYSLSEPHRPIQQPPLFPSRLVSSPFSKLSTSDSDLAKVNCRAFFEANHRALSTSPFGGKRVF